MEIPQIEKEKIPQCHFVQHEVLHSQYEMELRKILLDEATLLGNGEKYKVRIVFETDEGPRMVQTTVWGTTNSHVELKGGITIPVNAIREVLL